MCCVVICNYQGRIALHISEHAVIPNGRLVLESGLDMGCSSRTFAAEAKTGFDLSCLVELGR